MLSKNNFVAQNLPLLNDVVDHKSTKDNHLSFLYYSQALEQGCGTKLVINFVKLLSERELGTCHTPQTHFM